MILNTHTKDPILAHRLLMLMIFTIPLESVVQIEFIGSITRLVSPIVLILCMGDILKTGGMRKLGRFHFLSIVFVIWCTLSYQWSVDQDRSLVTLFTIYQLTILTVLVWAFADNTDKLKMLMTAYVLGSYVLAFDTAYQYISGNMRAYRARGAGADPNDLAITLSLTIPVVLYLSVHTKSRAARILYLLYVPVVVLAVAFTGSRTGFVAMLVSFSAFLLAKWRTQVMIIPVLIIIFFNMPSLLPEQSLMRIQGIPQEITSGTLSGRTIIWEYGLDVFYDHPYFGTGVGTFNAVVPRNRSSHNAFLSIAVELGLVGIVIFILIFLSLVLSLRSLLRHERVMWLAALASWGVGSMTLAWAYQKPTWLLFAFVATWVANKREEQNADMRP